MGQYLNESNFVRNVSYKYGSRNKFPGKISTNPNRRKSTTTCNLQESKDKRPNEKTKRKHRIQASFPSDQFNKKWSKKRGTKNSPHCPWSLTAATAPFFLQSTWSGRSSPSVAAYLPLLTADRRGFREIRPPKNFARYSSLVRSAKRVKPTLYVRDSRLCSSMNLRLSLKISNRLSFSPRAL